MLLLYFLMTLTVVPQSLTAQDKGLYPVISFFSPSDYQQHPQNWGITQDDFGNIYFANMNGVMRYNGHDWDMFYTSRTPVSIHYASDGTLYTAITNDIGFMQPLPNGTMEYVSILDSLEHDVPAFIDTYSITEINGDIYFITDTSTLHWDGNSFTAYEDVTYFFVTDHHSLMMLQRTDRSLFVPARPELEVSVNTSEPIRMLHGLFPQGDGSFIAFGYEGSQYRVLMHDDFIHVEDFQSSHLNWLSQTEVYDFFPGHQHTYIITTVNDGIYTTDHHGNLQNHFDETAGLRNNFVLAAFEDEFDTIWLVGYYGITKIISSETVSAIDERSGLKGELWSSFVFQDHLYVSTSRGLFVAAITEESVQRLEMAVDSETIGSIGDFRTAINPATGRESLFWMTLEMLYEIRGRDVVPVSRIVNGMVFRTSLYPDILFGTSGYQLFAAVKYENEQWTDSPEVLPVFNDAILSLEKAEKGLFYFSLYSEGVYKLRFNDPENPDTDTDWTVGPFGTEYLITKTIAEEVMNSDAHVIIQKIGDKLLFLGFDDIFTLDKNGEFIQYPDITENDEDWSYLSITGDRSGRTWYLRNDESVIDVGYVLQNHKGFTVGQPFTQLDIPITSRLHCCKGENGVFLETAESIFILSAGQEEPGDIPEFEIRLDRLMLVDGTALDFMDETGSQKHVLLSYEQNSLKFQAASNYITGAQKNQYSYFLKGADAYFSPFTHSNSREYLNLKEGNYELHIRARNAHGQLTETRMLSFTISPPYYRSLLAYILYALSIIGLIFLGVYLRTRSVVHQRNLLAERVKQRTLQLENRTRELSEQKIKLEQANEIKLRLLRMTAHDLRSPLSAITGYSGLIKLEDELQTVNQYADTIYETSLKMRGIIQSMLASGAKNLEHIHLDPEEVQIKELFESIKTQLALHLKKKSQELILKIPDNLPPINADKVRISEVFDNLINNAIKYSPASSEIRVLVRDESHLGAMLFMVVDEGPGFTEEDLKNVFVEKMRLSAKTTEGEESTGHGLFIVKQLVNAHGGEINIKNNGSGKGATITVLLPVARTDT